MTETIELEHLTNNTRITENPLGTAASGDSDPLEVALASNDFETFKTLIDQGETKVRVDVLTDILMNSDNLKYYEILLNSAHFDGLMNEKNKKGNYPLFYGIRYGGPKIVEDLLKHKASLANKNEFDVFDIADVDKDILQKHFDSCISTETRLKSSSPIDRYIKFNYETLIPTGAYESETEMILYLSKFKELNSLMNHPLIVSFLYMRWREICFIFYVNLVCYLVFSVSLVMYNLEVSTNKSIATQYTLFLRITTILSIIRKVFEIYISGTMIFTFTEHQIEGMLISISIYMCLTNDPPQYKIQEVTIACILNSFGLFFFVGNHPTFSTNMMIFRKVSSNFFAFFSFYSILITGFAFCFYTLFYANQITDNPFFSNMYLSLFKTIVMFTGEYEASNLPLDQYPFTSHLLFTFFVLIISVILLNLLNGLAVGDTQEITNQAKLYGYIAMLDYISYIEKMRNKCKFLFPNYQRTTYGVWTETKAKSLIWFITNQSTLETEIINDARSIVNKRGYTKSEVSLQYLSEEIRRINPRLLALEESLNKLMQAINKCNK